MPRLVLAALALPPPCACLPASSSSPPGDTAPPPPSHDADIQPIWDAACLAEGCHDSVSAAASLVLEPGAAWSQLVDVAAMEYPLFDRVEPGRSDRSFLAYKIQGTSASIGASGTDMPKDAELLDDQQQALILRWIDQGAEP